jgi:predicted AlkP superfamily phosphohydrolase/phosphomutase
VAFAGVIAASLLLASASPAEAYIGPGAGFALVSSFFAFLVTVVVAILSLALWPFRAAWRLVRRRSSVRPLIKRLIIVGLDGQDPQLTDRFLKAGKLPNFQKLADTGGYSRLRTTYPSVSPVAWSSFSTGTNPGRHNIFDFLDRDRRTYLPTLSSTRISKVERVLRAGRFRIPLRAPELRLLRKSTPFWSVLGAHGIWSTILRVPITFPPDRFYGAQLSAMSVPDLRGTQGTFTLCTTRPAGTTFKEGGLRIPVELRGDRIDASIPGPDNPLVDGPRQPLSVPLRVRLDRAAGLAHVDLDGQRVTLQPGRMTGWIPIAFRAAPGIKASGICRLLLTEMGEHVSLYVTPINLDPDRPAMPISHPAFYATYLAKRIGPFATLGLAEDTWALNEGVISDEDFLRQVYDVDREREAMFFAAFDRLRAGTLVSVFDATDRIQHMFWRQLETDRNPIEQLYEHNDAMIGRVMSRLQPDDVLLVLSDHGFAPFRRGVNINGWLQAEGYLTLKATADGTSEWLRDVDWMKTRAYAVGLSGMFLNLEGREGAGIVRPGAEAAALKAEIIGRLRGLVDSDNGDIAITEVFDTAHVYSGPYVDNAPDFIVGYNSGYRISWDSASGVVAGPIFQDNVKAWSGDHCIDPRLVPGVLFSSRPIDTADPALIDIAPTVLKLFGVRPPAYMEGKPLFRTGPTEGAAA